MPIVPIAINKPRIAIARNALFLKGDRGCRTSLAIPPSVMNNQPPLDGDTLALSVDRLTHYGACTIWRGLNWFQLARSQVRIPYETAKTSSLPCLRKSQRL